MKQIELAQQLQCLRFENYNLDQKPIKGITKDRLKYLGIYLLQNFSLKESHKNFVLYNLGIKNSITSKSEMILKFEERMESQVQIKSCELLLRAFEVIVKGIPSNELTDEHLQYINLRIDELNVGLN
ncbi:MAG: hypothetical protein LW821_02435 [Flammeovirgaceae bacterium]|jgi:hypothetical protein|nr:hypothetical protein [Flammeovirgaceae bacterium]